MQTKRHPLCCSWYLNFVVLTATKLFRATGCSSRFAHVPFYSLSHFHTKMAKPIYSRERPKLLHKKSGFTVFNVSQKYDSQEESLQNQRKIKF